MWPFPGSWWSTRTYVALFNWKHQPLKLHMHLINRHGVRSRAMYQCGSVRTACCNVHPACSCRIRGYFSPIRQRCIQRHTAQKCYRRLIQRQTRRLRCADLYVQSYMFLPSVWLCCCLVNCTSSTPRRLYPDALTRFAHIFAVQTCIISISESQYLVQLCCTT